MDYRGPDLKADLKTIWKTATTNFPKMAEAYLDANVAVHLSYTNSSKLDAKFLKNWRELRDQCEMIFGESARIFDDTAVALTESIRMYAEEDSEAANAIDQAGIDLSDDPPDMEKALYPDAYMPRGYDAKIPSRPDYEYDGSAPTVDELLEKANLLEDKLYAAGFAELNWLEQGAVSIGELFGAVGEYTNISAKIKEVAKDDVSSFSGAVGSLSSIFASDDTGLIERFNTEVNNAKLALNPDKWSGDAARSFTEDFLNTYEDTVNTQMPMVGTLLGAVKGYQDSLELVYKQYDQIMDAAINACNAVIQEENAKKDEIKLDVLEAAVTAGLSGETKIAYALAAKAVEISVKYVNVGEVAWDGEKDVNLSSSETPRTGKIVISCTVALDKAAERLTDLDEELSEKLGTDAATVYDARYKPSTRMQYARPAFTDNPEAL